MDCFHQQAAGVEAKMCSVAASSSCRWNRGYFSEHTEHEELTLKLWQTLTTRGVQIDSRELELFTALNLHSAIFYVPTSGSDSKQGHCRALWNSPWPSSKINRPSAKFHTRFRATTKTQLSLLHHSFIHSLTKHMWSPPPHPQPYPSG